MKKKHRYRRKPRVLWNGRYKPYYELTNLDEFNKELDTVQVYQDWLCFLDKIESSI